MGALTGQARAFHPCWRYTGALVLGAVLVVFPVRALEAQETAEAAAEAREAFEAGVAAARDHAWETAATQFERSMHEAPRVSAAFNLVVAYHHLDRPAAVVTTADRLLELADPDRHRAQRRAAMRLREGALQKVAGLELEVTPDAATVAVDGTPTPGFGPTRTVWLDPGIHQIVIAAEGFSSHTFEVSAEPGSRSTRHVPLSHLPAAHPLDASRDGGTPGRAPPPRPADAAERTASATGRPRTRQLVGLSLFALGAAALGSALVLETVSLDQAADLRSADPQQRGFLSDAHAYRRTRAVTLALSATGSLLLTTAGLLVGWEPRGPWKWWLAAAGAVLSAVGGYLSLHAPPRIGDTKLTGPGRSLGLLMLGTGVPLLSAAVVPDLWNGGTAAAPQASAVSPGVAGVALGGVFR